MSLQPSYAFHFDYAAFVINSIEKYQKKAIPIIK